MIVTIKHVLQYLYMSPEHHWQKMDLQTIEYADVNLLSLFYDQNVQDSEKLCFQACDSESLDCVQFNIYRDETHIMIDPILNFEVSQLNLIGKQDIHFINQIAESVSLLVRISVSIRILSAFIDGLCSNIWDIKPYC